MNGIEVRGVSKSYGNVQALSGVSVALEPGKIYGLLGRNGAGKTTLLNMITGRGFADAGEMTLDGEAILENDAALGKIYMLSEPTYYPPRMRVGQAVHWTKEFYPDFDETYASKLLGDFGLSPKWRIDGLSTGYNTIFKLVLALSTNAPYLLLDEPVLGLDANHRDLFYKTLIAKYAENPFCAVLSTHLVEEISPVIEEVIIIHAGKVLQTAGRDELLKQGYTVTGAIAAVDAFASGKTLLGQDAIGGLKTVYILGEKPQELPEGLELSQLDLQRLFIQLTGGSTGDTVFTHTETTEGGRA